MITSEQAKQIGLQLGVNWEEVDINQLRRGMEVELEHGSRYGKLLNVTNDDPVLSAKIALAHLKENPNYYTWLDRMEKEAKNHPEAE